MKYKYAAAFAVFFTLIVGASIAWFPHGAGTTYDNACGTVPVGQAWCVNASGWTVVTPESGSGTCSNSSSNYTGTCVAAADNTIAATFSGTISGATGSSATLTVNSGTAPSVGQTVFLGTSETGITKLGTIASGANPTFTLTTTASNQGPVSMNSTAGNDATCAAVTAASLGITDSISMSSLVHPSPCFTTGQAINNKIRNNSSDWFIMKRGGDWGGGIGTITTPAGTISKSGKSVNRPLLITSYGTGSFPTLRHGPFSLMGNTNATNCIGHNASSGQYIAYISFRCYDDHLDPNSPNYYGATVTGDVGAANCGAANIICNITPSVPSFLDTSHYRIAGAGLPAVGTQITAFTGSTVTTVANTTLAATTGVKFQIITSDAGFYISQGGPTNFAILEDIRADYTTIFSFQENYSAGGFDTTMPFQVRIRRNTNPRVGSNGSNIFTGTNYSSQPNPYMLIEENVSGYGGWEPNLWSRPMDVTTHGYYLHDPSVCGTVKGNIIAYQSADTQNRPGFNFNNNLFLGGGTNLLSVTTQPTSSNCGGVGSFESYDVMTLSGDLANGVRTATATNSGASAVLSFDGSNMGTGMRVVDLNNPGAIPSNATLSTATATGGTLSTNVVAGIRGNGVQSGDTLLFFTSQGRGTILSQGGLYLFTGPATCGNPQCYAGASTGVTISNASPAVITEPSTSFSRSANEPFKFTGGTLPPEIDTVTTYCSDASGATYHIYPSTIDGNGATTCPGASGNLINTSGSSVNATRQGSRLLLFTMSPAASTGTIPYDGVPATLAFGNTVKMDLNNFATNPTTVSWVAPDRKSIIVADPIVTASAGSFNGTGQRAVIFNIGTASANTVPASIGPNNVYISQSHLVDVSQGNGAINLDANTYALSATYNYAYNWSSSTQGAAFRDFGLPGNTITPQLMNTYNIGCSVLSLPTSNNDNTACFPLASIEYYDATKRGSNTFNGTFANNGFGGSTLTINSGTAPSVGDTIFTVSGSNLPQYTKVVSGSGSTFTTTNTVGSVTANMMFGSDTHFFSQALSQNRSAGWSSDWTAKGAGNYIRSAIQCGNAAVYTGAPPCPAQ